MKERAATCPIVTLIAGVLTAQVGAAIGQKRRWPGPMRVPAEGPEGCIGQPAALRRGVAQPDVVELGVPG